MKMDAELCGRTLAKAYARTGDAIAIASYLGSGDSFDRALAAFAETYADQNERDYRALQDAVDSGRIAAEAGVALADLRIHRTAQTGVSRQDVLRQRVPAHLRQPVRLGLVRRRRLNGKVARRVSQPGLVAMAQIATP
jgi:hypothetical protein